MISTSRNMTIDDLLLHIEGINKNLGIKYKKFTISLSSDIVDICNNITNNFSIKIRSYHIGFFIKNCIKLDKINVSTYYHDNDEVFIEVDKVDH